jgi:hypothetical protein
MEKKRLFEKVDPPRSQAKLAINRHAHWFTWSSEFRFFLKEWKAYSRTLSRLEAVFFDQNDEYAWTYTLNMARISDAGIKAALDTYTKRLFEMKVPRQIMLLTDLLGGCLDRRALQMLFAALRAGLVDLLPSPRHAVFSRAQVERKDRQFLLHADLYIPELLFNVFDVVPDDDSGASMFLSLSSLRRILPRIEYFDINAREELLTSFSKTIDRDGFNRVYRLLHGSHNPWVPELEKAMDKEKLRIKLRTGQGYLIHDRKWLHGREVTSGNVSCNRFYRLVFNNAELTWRRLTQ